MTARSCIERYVKGRDLAVSVLDSETPGEEPVALPVVEAIPREEDFYDYESRYEIGMTTFVCPAELSDEIDRARAGAGPRRPTGCSAAAALRASI